MAGVGAIKARDRPLRAGWQTSACRVCISASFESNDKSEASAAQTTAQVRTRRSQRHRRQLAALRAARGVGGKTGGRIPSGAILGDPPRASAPTNRRAAGARGGDTPPRAVKAEPKAGRSPSRASLQGWRDNVQMRNEPVAAHRPAELRPPARPYYPLLISRLLLHPFRSVSSRSSRNSTTRCAH